MQRARGETPRKPARNLGHLPPHLPRIERVIEPASLLCRCGCGEMVAHSTEDGQRFHGIVGIRSTAWWAAIPREGGRLI